MSRLPSHRSIPWLLVTLTSACGSSTGPSETPGVYVLRQVADNPLPAILTENENYTTYVLADTLRLHGNGTGSVSEVLESVPVGSDLPAPGPMHIKTDFTYTTTANGDLEITFLCPPMALCIAPPHLIARLIPKGLNARWGPHMVGRAPLLYTLISGAP